MKIVVIVQARMTSSRLPGKVLKPILGKPMLALELERLRRVSKANEIVVATTTEDSDRPIVDLCTRMNIASYRGSEEDVLKRFHQAALAQRADAVVRVTADCPLIDPAIVDRVIDLYRDGGDRFDYVSNVLERTYPRGLDCEIVSFKALDTAFRETTLSSDREHVTPYFYNHPELFRLGSVKNLIDESRHRWTVDTPEDLELIEKVYTALYPKTPHFEMKDVLRLLEQNPEWVKINQNVRQKTLHGGGK